MQTHPVDWLEFVQALSPYVTAIIAIVASVVTAWLAQRNWLKQFLAEKSFAVGQEKIRLLEEIPPKLMRAAFLSQKALIWRAQVEVLAELIAEQESSPEEAMATLERFKQRHTSAIGQVKQM